MRPDPPAPRLAQLAWRVELPHDWRRPLIVLAATMAALVIVFVRDWADMAGQWWNSSTYTHVLLVPVILGWLVQQRWGELRRLTPVPWWPGLILFCAPLLLWVLGAFAGFSLFRQAGAVGMELAAVLALLGPRVGAGLAFPLAYAAFLVPFGDELIPPLQTVTAKLTIAMVNASGIHAAIDGVFIDTPAGLFEVAEACSGIKFLIAMIAFGVLAAHVCFRSWPRRIGFVALCVVVPVLANGVRAWGTVAVAQVKGAAYAGGFDHIVYGWVFFAVVIALVIAVGWPFFDRPADAPLIDVERINASPLLARFDARPVSIARIAIGMAGLVLLGQAWAFAADRLDATVPARIDLPQVPGWQRADYRPQLWWEPRGGGADHRLLGRYVDGQGRAVDVFYGLWSGQSEGREAGGFGQGALVPDSGWAWRADAPAPQDGGVGGRAEWLLGKGAVDRLAITWYRTGPLLSGSNARLKLANIADRLLLRQRPTMVLILSVERRPGTDPQAALRAFATAAGPLGPWMDRIGGVKH